MIEGLLDRTDYLTLTVGRASDDVLVSPFSRTYLGWTDSALVIGTPEVVAEHIREALRKAPISDIVISPRLSTKHMPVETIMEIVARQVRPLTASG